MTRRELNNVILLVLICLAILYPLSRQPIPPMHRIAPPNPAQMAEYETAVGEWRKLNDPLILPPVHPEQGLRTIYRNKRRVWNYGPPELYGGPKEVKPVGVPTAVVMVLLTVGFVAAPIATAIYIISKARRRNEINQ